MALGWAIPLALASGATWAIGMTVAKPALRQTDHLTYLLGRWIVVAALAAGYAAIRGDLFFPGWNAFGWAIGAGLVDAVAGGLLYQLALERTETHQTTTLASTVPLWGVVSAVLFLGESSRWTVIIAAILVVAGAYFLIGRGRLRLRSALVGSALALLTAILWGVAETVPSKLALDAGMTPPLQLLVFSLSAVAGTALLMPFLRTKIPLRISPRGLLLTAISGAGGAFLGWVLWLSSLQIAPASVISPVRGSTILFAFVYSVLFLKERPMPAAFLGGALVLVGVVLVSVGG